MTSNLNTLVADRYDKMSIRAISIQERFIEKIFRTAPKAGFSAEWCGVSPSQPTRRPGKVGARNAFWHVLKSTKRSFLHLYADAVSSSVFRVTFGGKAEVCRGQLLSLPPTQNRPCAYNVLSPHTNNIEFQFFCNFQQIRHLFWVATELPAERHDTLVIHWR